MEDLDDFTIILVINADGKKDVRKRRILWKGEDVLFVADLRK